MIPKIFVKDYGKLLSSFVFLKLPDGMEWKVGLTTAANGAVWLQKGWDKFLEHYCLEFGSLLVFRLLDGRKSSSFDVTIFDPTGVETQYSCNVNNCTPDSDCDESLEGFEGLLKKRKKASVPCFRSCKKTRKQDSFSIKVEPVEEVAEGCRNFSDIPNCKKKMPKEDEVWISNKGQVLKNKGESTEKPGFKVVMSQSNVGGRFNMAIPEKFARKYLCEEFGSISLQTTNGRKWAVLYKWSRNKDEKVAYFCSGWRVFVQENLLKAGDVVFFEPIKKHRFLFTKLQDTAPFSSPSPNNKIASTRNPFFKVKIHLKSYGNAVLNIPMGFAKKHLSPEMYYAKLQVRNKEWNVTLKQYESHSRFSAGWSKFYHENGLRDGNTCLFEMVSKTNCIFKVTIFNK